jgi:hypothetical protein
MSSSPLSDIPAHSLGSAEDSLGSAMVGAMYHSMPECVSRARVRTCRMYDKRRTDAAVWCWVGQMHELT